MKNRLILPALSGLILGLSYPPLPAGFLAWFGLVPLFFSVRDCSLGEAARRGGIFALVHSAVSLYFIAFNSGAPWYLAVTSWIGLVAILTLTGPMFTIPLNLAFKRWKAGALIAAPFFWTSIEYLRSLGEIAFPWNIFPLTQANYLAPCQMAVVTGIWGLSFWVAGINSLMYLVLSKARIWLIPALLWVSVPFAIGFWVLSRPPAASDKLNVAVVQGNVDPAGKWANGLLYNLKLYWNLTEGISDADLIVWPETAVPARLNLEIRARRFLRNLSERIDTPIFTGALAKDETPEGTVKRFNSAYLIKPGEDGLERYDKLHLVPFGERVPWQKFFPQLGKLNFGQAEFTPGSDYKIFRLDSLNEFGAMICFESVLPQIARRYVAEGADFLINITNDGWYGKTSEPCQQALLTRFRAIENGRSLIRAANTGISYLADAQGRFLTRSKLEVEDVLRAEIPINRNQTFYQQHGDVFANLVLIVSITVFILTILSKYLYKPSKTVAVAVFILLTGGQALGDTGFLTLSSSSARRISLAGPAAMEGYVAEAPVNPAGYNFYTPDYRPRFTVFFNPVGSIVAAEGLQNGPESDGVLNEEDFAIPLMILFRGFAFSYRSFNAGLILGEQPQGGTSGDRMFEYFPLFDDYCNRLFLQLKLHDKIALGMSAEMFSRHEKIEKVGVSYGVMIKPGKMNVGVFYYLLPEKNQYDLLPHDRIAEDTVNAGLSWQPLGFLKCFFDLRNLSEENAPAFLEPHLGIETTPWEHTSFRAGFYREEGEENAFSFGLGICDLNRFRSLDDRSGRKEYLLDYGMCILPGSDTLHALSFHFRL